MRETADKESVVQPQVPAPLTYGLAGSPAMPVKLLTESYRQILEVLDEDGGFTVAHISKLSKSTYCIGHNRVRSGAIRSWLDQLRMLGFVRLLDDEKPSAWVRTPAGSAALAEPSST